MPTDGVDVRSVRRSQRGGDTYEYASQAGPQSLTFGAEARVVQAARGIAGAFAKELYLPSRFLDEQGFFFHWMKMRHAR
jgi:hypothetical protein